MESSNEPVLKFISIDESKEENLRHAAQVSKEYELKSEWVSISSCNVKGLDDVRTESSVFVLGLFEGEHFEHLKSNKCRVVGPQCILSCLQTETSLPNVHYPVYSIAMRGCFVSCTSVPRQERDRLYELIQLMGGTAMKDFTSSVTHLVAGEVGSKKYRVACSFKKPILLPDWVYNCWERGKGEHICASDEEFMEFKCPVFKGVTLCVTGIDADKRKEIKNLVTLHGGTYSGELNMNTCTHLLVDTPKGEKYEFARRWNLHCVCTQWFYDSIQSGYCVEESNFLTLPEDEHNGSQVRSRISHNLVASSGEVPSKGKVEKKISKKAAQAAYISAQKHGNGDLMSGNKKLSSNQSQQHITSRLGETRLSDLESSVFDVSVQPGNMFLDGCKIYLSGFSGERLEKLRKIINSGGGTRFNQINEIVSHVIVGDVEEADLNLLRSCEFQVFVVTVQWILESARKGKRLPEEDYLCLDLIQKEEPSPSSKENKDPTVKPTEKPPVNRTDSQHKAPDSRKGPKNTECEEDDDEVFLQYMPQNKNGAIESVESSKGVDSREEKKEIPTTNADPDATLDEEDECEADTGLLSGKYFTIAGFADEHVEHLWQLIESNGGKAVMSGDSTTADFAILYMNTVPDDDLSAKQVTTFCWLEQSLEHGRLLDLEESFLFTPFCIPKGCLPLQGCVLSISQFAGVEVDHMYQLAELLGAHCQEYFVRKASSKYQANTHLLCQEPDGNKYKAAVKWKIPVVSKEWLFACASTGALVPTEKYPVGKKGIGTADNIGDVSLERPSTSDNGAKSTSVPMEVRTRSPPKQPPVQTSGASSALQPTSSSSREEIMKTGTASINKLAENHASLPKLPVKRQPVGNRPFRPSFDLTDVMAELASPAIPAFRSRKSRGSRSSFPLDDFFAENIQQTLQKIGGVAPPNWEGGEDITDDGLGAAEEQDQEGLVTSLKQGILAGIILSASKKLAQQQTELYTIASSLGADYRWLYDESCTHLIHQGSANDKTKEFTQAKDRGVHIVSPHWLYVCQEKSERVDETSYPHTYNPKLSLPVVTTGRRLTRSSKTMLEREMSPQKKKKSPTLKKVESSEQISSEKSKNTSSVPVESEQPKEVSGDQGVAEGVTELVQQGPPMGPGTLESLEARDDFKRQLEAIMDATKGKGRRRSRRHTSTSNSTNTSHNTPESVTSAETSLATRRTSSRLRSRVTSKAGEGMSSTASSRVKSRGHVTEDSEHSQSDTITYDDPVGRMERERIMAQLKRGCSPGSEVDTEAEDQEEDNTHMNVQTKSKESSIVGETSTKNSVTVEQLCMTIKSEPPSPVSSSTPAAPPLALQIKDAPKPKPINLLDGTELNQTRVTATPKFQLSVMTPQEKIDYSALIEQLGGKVFDTVYFNPECTHVVVGKPNRNEKYLAAVAAGKWVLHKSFLEASREAGHFVDEAQHEWGLDIPGEPSNKLAAAAQRWRIRLLQERTAASEVGQGTNCCGAFSGWTVVLCVDKSRQPGFKRLLEAGGAKVSGGRPPFKNPQDFSHAFLDLSKTKVEASDLHSLHEADVWCLKPDYIAEYLMQEPPPPPQKFLLPELVTQVEPDKQVLSLSRKRKGDELTGSDKRARV